MKTHSALPLILALAFLCPLAPAQETTKPARTEAVAEGMKTEKWPDITSDFFLEAEEDEDAFRAVQSPVEMLKAAGVNFSKGASASYDEKKLTLIVTNTPEELRKVDKVVREYMKDRPELFQMTWKLSKSFVKEHKAALKKDAREFLLEQFGFEIMDAKLTGSKLTVTATEENLEELDDVLQVEEIASKGKKKKHRGKANRAKKTKKADTDAKDDDEEENAFED